jgi:prefoldin alpha subunit
VKLTDLPVPQLSQLKKQFDDELSNLTSSFQSLRQAQAKFKDCLLSLQKGVKAENEGRTILVPLTSSLYVPGRLEGVEKVIVDVGECIIPLRLFIEWEWKWARFELRSSRVLCRLT